MDSKGQLDLNRDNHWWNLHKAGERQVWMDWKALVKGARKHSTGHTHSQKYALIQNLARLEREKKFKDVCSYS